MDRLRTSLIAACCGLLCLAPRIFGQTATFSSAQASHGGGLFHEKCGARHANDLEGGQEAPPLKGDVFWSEWERQAARALYSRIISTMPPDSPGSLEEKDVIDIVAFVASQNGVALGTRTVESASELNSIKLERRR